MSSNNVKDASYYEDTIRKMNVLSRSQTAFLKAYIHNKLEIGNNLVKKSLDLIATIPKNTATKDIQKKADEIKASLNALKLNELEVDVNSTSLILQEELKTLRNAISQNNVPLPPPPPSQTNSVSSKPEDKEMFKKLQKEHEQLMKTNAELQELVKKAKDDGDKLAQNMKKTNTQSDSKAVTELNATIKSLNDKIKEKDSAIQKLNSDIENMKKDYEKQLKDVAAKSKAQEEKMLAAIALEIEAVENSKSKEIEELTAKIAASNQQTAKAVSDLQLKYNQSFAQMKNQMKELKQQNQANRTTSTSELNEMKQTITKTFGASIQRRLKVIDDQFNVVNARYKRELSERKRLHNIVQELKGNIRVFLRCRPPTPKELESLDTSSQFCVSFPNPGEIKVFNEKMKEKTWEFDEVFGLDSTQQDVYNDVSDLVVSVLDGYNVCVFAYGQTGTGKTYTMSGSENNRGVNTRALSELFDRSESRKDDYVTEIQVSILEVYNEEIRDLMNDSNNGKLEIRQSDQGNYVPGLTAENVVNLQQVFRLLEVADKLRSQNATNMNEHSSRSHMMLQVTVTSLNKHTNVSTRGKLNLVDLAGSERLSKSLSQGQALKETQNINKSLSALGDVIAARVEKQAHIPFRNSTLTYLLKDSLSQDSKTLMIVCISPVLYNAEETFCSLNFAARVRSVELGKASKNVMNASGAKSGSFTPSPKR